MIEVKSLGKSYGAINAVDDLSFTVEAGQVGVPVVPEVNGRIQ